VKSAAKSEAVVRKTRIVNLRRHAAKNQPAAPAPEVAAAPPEEAPRREIKPAAMNSCVPIEQKNVRWKHSPRVGTPREDLNSPAYLSVIGNTMRPGDMLEVHGEDSKGPFFAELQIRQAGPGFDPVAVTLRVVDLPPLQHKGTLTWPVGYEPRYNTATNSWFVYRLSDGWCMTAEPGIALLVDLYTEFVKSAIFRQ
jgi:hypothetical protein